MSTMSLNLRCLTPLLVVRFLSSSPSLSESNSKSELWFLFGRTTGCQSTLGLSILPLEGWDFTCNEVYWLLKRSRNCISLQLSSPKVRAERCSSRTLWLSEIGRELELSKISSASLGSGVGQVSLARTSLHDTSDWDLSDHSLWAEEAGLIREMSTESKGLLTFARGDRRVIGAHNFVLRSWWEEPTLSGVFVATMGLAEELKYSFILEPSRLTLLSPL